MLAHYLLAIAFAAVVHSHPDGAPLSACDTMRPNHQFYQPQNSTPPYQITVSNNSPAVGEPIEVTISAPTGEQFQGFLIKALPEEALIGVAGLFVNTLPNAHYLNCSGIDQSAVTHSDPNNKTSVTVSWSVDTPGSYNLIATVAEYFTTFWVRFHSEVITVQ
ncbi:hypothetical protein CHUAL_009392 [Chamberlinius hualienensis]